MIPRGPTRPCLPLLEIRIPAHKAAIARQAPVENLDVWSAYHLALEHVYRFNRGDNGVAMGLFERAVRLDPMFARAHAGLSFIHFQSAFMHYTNDARRRALEGREHVDLAMRLSPLDPLHHAMIATRAFTHMARVQQALLQAGFR